MAIAQAVSAHLHQTSAKSQALPWIRSAIVSHQFSPARALQECRLCPVSHSATAPAHSNALRLRLMAQTAHANVLASVTPARFKIHFLAYALHRPKAAQFLTPLA
jgi:hypothetical protein